MRQHKRRAVTCDLAEDGIPAVNRQAASLDHGHAANVADDLRWLVGDQSGLAVHDEIEFQQVWRPTLDARYQGASAAAWPGQRGSAPARKIAPTPAGT